MSSRDISSSFSSSKPAFNKRCFNLSEDIFFSSACFLTLNFSILLVYLCDFLSGKHEFSFVYEVSRGLFFVWKQQTCIPLTLRCRRFTNDSNTYSPVDVVSDSTAAATKYVTNSFPFFSCDLTQNTFPYLYI